MDWGYISLDELGDGIRIGDIVLSWFLVFSGVVVWLFGCCLHIITSPFFLMLQ